MSVLPELKVSTTLRTARGKINETRAVNVRARKAIEIINLYGFKNGQSSFKAEIRFDLLRSRGSASASFVIAIIKFSRQLVKNERMYPGQEKVLNFPKKKSILTQTFIVRIMALSSL